MIFFALTLLADFGSPSFSGCKAPAPLLHFVCEVGECPACTSPFPSSDLNSMPPSIHTPRTVLSPTIL